VSKGPELTDKTDSDDYSTPNRALGKLELEVADSFDDVG
jgi:hypothetical protein